MEDCDKKKYNGTIKINGKILLNQFFGENGVGDADTVKIGLTPDSIKFRKTRDSTWQENLRLFDTAYYYDEDSGRRKKILANDNKNNQHIRIRLQGIDAPELHYRASKGNVFLYEDQFSRFKSLNELFEFRQHYGARAAKELVILLNTYSMSDNNQKYVNAYAFSSIDQPSELFDRYGRTVSDIVIYKDNEENGINLNQWLVQEGWAFPDFYDSMSNDEISILMEKSKEAVDAQKGIRPHYSKELVDFDFNLVFEKENDDSIIANDSGLLNLPKFFRKQVDWQIIKKSGNSIKTLKKYISLRKDACYLLKDFLEKRHCAPKHELSEFVDEDGSMNVDPGSLVNIESDSQIETPNIITSWY